MGTAETLTERVAITAAKRGASMMVEEMEDWTVSC